MLLVRGLFFEWHCSRGISKAVKLDTSIASTHRMVLIPFD